MSLTEPMIGSHLQSVTEFGRVLFAETIQHLVKKFQNGPRVRCRSVVELDVPATKPSPRLNTARHSLIAYPAGNGSSYGEREVTGLRVKAGVTALRVIAACPATPRRTGSC